MITIKVRGKREIHYKFKDKNETQPESVVALDPNEPAAGE